MYLTDYSSVIYRKTVISILPIQFYNEMKDNVSMRIYLYQVYIYYCIILFTWF